MAGDNSPNIRNEQIEAMIQLASRKLKMPPEQLKRILSNPGQTDALLNRIGGQTAYDSAVKDPGAVEKLLRDNPQVRKIIEGLTDSGPKR